MKIIDIDIVVPILVKEIKPNSIIIPTPEILSVGSSSIEVSQSFQCDVDYLGGIVCDTDPQATEASFKKNPGTLVQAISGLHNDTDYYIKGAGLPVLGNFTYGEGLKVHTLTSPIPPEFQLVEYLESTGTQYINTGYYPIKSDEIILTAAFVEYVIFQMMGCMTDGNTYNRCHIACGTQNNIAMYTDRGTTYFSIPFNTLEHTYKFTELLLYIDNLSGNNQCSYPSAPFYLFARNYNGVQNYCKARVIHFEVVGKRNLYPVYLKSNGKPGMYDIVTNQFYTNQGSGEFEVGPDKEFEE